MMKYIVAVSGGVDSVMLLDRLVREKKHEIIVAHFDHGIRPESADDAHFVGLLARSYQLPFETKRVELGEQASEQLARDHRYSFLFKLAAKHDARVVTAHHQDDAIETIAINLTRGTGWRGLAVFGDQRIERPLMMMTKPAIYDEAVRRKLEWVEDATNQQSTYLRNRLRKKMHQLDNELTTQLVTLWQRQCQLRDEIDGACNLLINQNSGNSRYFFTMVDEATADELLVTVLRVYSLSLTRPQRARLLQAIKVAASGTIFEAGADTHVTFTKREFIVKNTSKLLL